MKRSRPSKLDYFCLLFVFCVFAFVLTACENAGAQTFMATPTLANSSTPTATHTLTHSPTTLAETPTLSPTLNPEASATPELTVLPAPSSTPTQIVQFFITVHNPYSWDVHLFVDNLFVMTIPANETRSHGAIQAGTRTFHYCQAKVMLTCAQPVTINITGDTRWEMGQVPTIEPTPAVPTPIKISTPIPPPVYYSVQTWQIKVNNYFPWRVYIFLDDELFLSIPQRTYVTYSGIPAGKYTFNHCHDQDREYCFLKKTVEINRNTEWSVIP